MKYLGINRYRVPMTRVMKKIKQTLNKWGGFHYSWFGRFSISKMLVLPKLLYRFNEIPVKIPGNHFVGTNQLILNAYKNI